MKNYLIILKLILIPYIAICQSTISEELKTKMQDVSNSTFLPIEIQVYDNFDILKLKAQFFKDNTPVKKRASIICQKMQNIAKKTQESIISNITSSKQKFKNLKSSWIINTIFLDATPTLIKAISNNPNIELIKSKNMRPDVIDYFDSHNSIEIENGTEPGIEAINVRPLWDMGYSGKNTIVFNYDTGVWPEHPAFSNRFLANFYPMNQCWDGYFSNIPNGHVSDHGTHTLGTMSGLVEETNDTIGIAFNSYWIANDFVTSTVETLPPIEDMITSFEWALNPDGNVDTDYDVPDVINNSWRWYNDIDTFQCSGYTVELMNIIEAAGIANIFSAGNNGPDNDGVRSPQRINTNLVNTFCVGSINANNTDYPISTFSCRGPTQCPGEGSLAIYPEVVAPGQNVRSAWGQDGFNTISGTSMASPHVSGAVLLLKEAFPFLTGEEILLALYNTASDLGDYGEDNTYGMGIIDTYAAFNYLSNIYNPIPPNFIENDLVLVSVTNGLEGITCSEEFIPTINILNNTDSIISEINIYYIDYANMTEEDSITFAVNLLPNESSNIILPTIENESYGDKEYSFRVSTIDPLEEIDYHNNRKIIRYKYKPSIEIPFYEDFQNGITNTHWHINNSDYSRTWDTITTGGLNTNNVSAYVNLYEYNPRSEQKDELIGPNIILSGDDINLSFQIGYQKYNSSSKQDTLQVFLSNDCGQNFSNKIFEKGGEDLSTVDEITANFIPENNNQWREEIVELSDFSGSEIMIKFVTTNLRGNNIVIDNVNIYNANTNNLAEDKQIELSLHPNPSTRKFELSSNYSIKQIRVYNTLGTILIQTILDKEIKKYDIDLNRQVAGMYFIQVDTEQGPYSIKAIKK